MPAESGSVCASITWCNLFVPADWCNCVRDFSKPDCTILTITALLHNRLTTAGIHFQRLNLILCVPLELVDSYFFLFHSSCFAIYLTASALFVCYCLSWWWFCSGSILRWSCMVDRTLKSSYSQLIPVLSVFFSFLLFGECFFLSFFLPSIRCIFFSPPPPPPPPPPCLAFLVCFCLLYLQICKSGDVTALVWYCIPPPPPTSCL